MQCRLRIVFSIGSFLDFGWANVIAILKTQAYLFKTFVAAMITKVQRAELQAIIN